MTRGVWKRTKKQLEDLKKRGFKKGYKGNLGKHFSEATKLKISLALTGKKHPHTKEQDMNISKALMGIKRSPLSDERKKQISLQQKGHKDYGTKESHKRQGLSLKNNELLKGEKHYYWKGEKASYSAVHHWIKRWKGKPDHCEICGRSDKTRYNWANIDHTYRRILDEYMSVCVPCHRKYDIENNL